TVLENKHRKDYKTLLQEFVQKKYKTYPKYPVVKKTGPEHDNTFYVEVIIQKKSFGPGCGNNKKEGEQAAAKIAFEALSH
ncbi:MAG: putative dsRNA-binding protein, partial [Sphaerochaetaceae bacterium]